MCIAFFEFRPSWKTPFIIGANREEQFGRPMEGPAFVKIGDMDAWVAGIDRGPRGQFETPGTWFGVNRNQVVVALLNRDDSVIHGYDAKRSRGLLCWDLLSSASAEEAADRVEKMTESETEVLYAGFNVIMADRKHVYSFGTQGCDPYPPFSYTLLSGFHCVCNLRCNDPLDERVQTTLNIKPAHEHYQEYCKQLDIADGTFGTRCSTVVKLGELEIHHRIGGEFSQIELPWSETLGE
jgi:hypothetical protein